MNATTTATTVSRIARCKDCGTVTKVTRETRTYCGWPQERLTEKVTNEFGERSEWVGTRSKLAAVVCRNCGSTNTTARKIVAKHSNQECNEKCMGATGPACECMCDGANHGGSHA
jgi:uncharacterized OB-fold protein